MFNIPNLKYKTTPCINYSQGLPCDKKDGCYFAHGSHELRTMQQNRQAIANRNAAFLQGTLQTNFKTVFCKFYAKGQCKLGDACTFAHERREKKMKRSNTISYGNESQYAQYFAYYSQLQSWMAQYGTMQHQFPTNYQASAQVEMYGGEKEMMETSTVQSQSPALSKSSNEGEFCQKEGQEHKHINLEKQCKINQQTP